jgi:twitching motility protein PilJ
MATQNNTSEFKIPLIGHLPFAQQLRALVTGIAVCGVVAATAMVLDFRASSQGAHRIKLSGDLVMLTQRIAKDAASAIQGKQTAIEGLPQAHAEVEGILKALDQGDENASAAGGSARATLDKLIPVAKQAMEQIAEVELGKAAILTVGQALAVTNEVTQPLREEMDKLPGTSLNPSQNTRLSLFLERVARDAALMQGSAVTVQQVAAMGQDIAAAEKIVAEIRPNDPAAAKMLDLFDGYRSSIEAVIGQAVDLVDAKKGVTEYFGMVSVTKKGAFVTGAQDLTVAYQASLKNRGTLYLLVVAVLLSLALIGLLAQLYLAESRHRAEAAERINRENQDAILLLMNELGDLADGDLTVQATVSESITGAIADSVNFTTGELRHLVSGVNSASQQVTQAAGEAGAVTQELIAAANKQSAEIQDVGGAVDMITRSIQEVDESATQSAAAAQKTLEVTAQGAQAVQNTITGMNSIREQIQDTSKRIKRLGESSQEIGEIVDLISDITEQTNVLALNAAIQAASAGEAGRGFSVVAAEVQRLAERSAEATKQIGALVQTIQADTHDAVAAMEKSTQGVVEGARLSDAAGQSLREIETTTRDLANLVNSISVSTQVQTDMASEVASAMADILRITEQTTAGTQRSAAAITQLGSLATELQSSVSGFKL